MCDEKKTLKSVNRVNNDNNKRKLESESVSHSVVSNSLLPYGL